MICQTIKNWNVTIKSIDPVDTKKTLTAIGELYVLLMQTGNIYINGPFRRPLAFSINALQRPKIMNTTISYQDALRTRSYHKDNLKLPWQNMMLIIFQQPLPALSFRSGTC